MALEFSPLAYGNGSSGGADKLDPEACRTSFQDTASAEAFIQNALPEIEILRRKIARRYSRTLNPQDVEDIVSLTLENILKYSGHKYREDFGSTLEAYVGRIFENAAKKILDKRIKILKFFQSSGDLRNPNDPDGNHDPLERSPSRDTSPVLNILISQEEELILKDVYFSMLSLIWGAYQSLPQVQQDAIRLVDFEDKSYIESAQLLGLKINNFKMVLRRGRLKLGAILNLR